MIGSFSSLSAFIHMGGYADYVWPAYAMVLIALLANLIGASAKLKRLIKKIRKVDVS